MMAGVEKDVRDRWVELAGGGTASGQKGNGTVRKSGPVPHAFLIPKLDGAWMGPNKREISRKRQPGPPRLTGH